MTICTLNESTSTSNGRCHVSSRVDVVFCFTNPFFGLIFWSLTNIFHSNDNVTFTAIGLYSKLMAI